jgi:(p)ppGpp synthase/HD superfamily hydrolase
VDDLPSRARSFAAGAYRSGQELEHPTEVATLVGSDDPELYAAALLHDLVEDTGVELDDVSEEFGPRVGALVAAMTEDSSISDYRDRKQEARERARDAGRDAATLFVADKLSNIRRMRRGKKEPEPRKLQHYRDTVATMKAAYPDLPLLADLADELRLRGAALSSAPAGPPQGASA